MRFTKYYSSSRGNLYTVAINGKRILLECGVTWKRLTKALDYKMSDIAFCLLTHDHKDHSKVVEEVMKAGIDVYASAGTLGALGVENNRRAKLVEDKAHIQLDGIGIIAIALNHDALEPLGFVIWEQETSEYLLFVPDTSHITQRFNLSFSIIAIECSYDKDILQQRVDNKEINETLAKRLLTSHMEKRVAIKYIAEFCDLSRCREIHLLHMSGDNINRLRTKKEFEERFFIETFV